MTQVDGMWKKVEESDGKPVQLKLLHATREAESSRLQLTTFRLRRDFTTPKRCYK